MNPIFSFIFKTQGLNDNNSTTWTQVDRCTIFFALMTMNDHSLRVFYLEYFWNNIHSSYKYVTGVYLS